MESWVAHKLVSAKGGGGRSRKKNLEIMVKQHSRLHETCSAVCARSYPECLEILQKNHDLGYLFEQILGPWATGGPSWPDLGTPRMQTCIPRPQFSRFGFQIGTPMETPKSPLGPQGDHLSLHMCFGQIFLGACMSTPLWDPTVN